MNLIKLTKHPFTLPSCLVFLVILILFIAPYIKKTSGDGMEYVLSAHAIYSHFSPSIHASDIDYYSKSDSDRLFFKSHLFSSEFDRDIKWSAPLGKNAYFIAPGFLKANHGSIYTWHYWLYPAIASPFLLVTDQLNLSSASAFWLCNCFLMLATLCYACFYWKASNLQKSFLMAGYLLSGTSYYLKWTHPEVMTASFILIGLMAIADKRHWLGLVAVAIAATQNPPILFLLLILMGYILFQLVINIKSRKFTIILKNAYSDLVAMAFSLLIAISPMIFYYNKIGVLNPISSLGYSDFSLISFARLNSLYFDLNMGMLIAMPGTFLVGLYVLSAFNKRNYNAISLSYFQYAVPIFLGMLISVLMAIPTLTTINWNHGSSVLSRYAYWLAIPILFGLAVNLKYLRFSMQRNILIFLIVVQSMVVLNNKIFGNNSFHLAFKPLAKVVMSKLPSAYNPIPEIFIERVLGREEAIPIGDAAEQLLMYPNQQNPTKILVRQSGLAEILKKLPKNCQYNQSSELEGKWFYLNLSSCTD